MSYILDALKRADSERERGLVPGLHAQPVPVEMPGNSAYRAVKPIVLLVACAGLVLLGVMVWRWLSPSPAPVSAMPVAPQIIAAAPPAAPIPPRPAPEQAPTLTPSPQPPLPAAISTPPEVAKNPAPNPAPAPRMVMAPAQITPAPSAAERAQERAEPETRSAPSRATPRPFPPPAQPANTQAAPGATPAVVARVAPLAELPADIRLALPKLVISGATYADNPAYRMLIINGQVFHEGEKLSTDLLLEKIGPKSAVLNFKGQRYSLGY